MKMAKVWTEKDIRAVFNEISSKMGVDCSYVPIRISNKMTSCKGKCRTKKISNRIKGVELVFSTHLINGNYEEDVVREVIIHEYIHLYTNVKNNKFCKHNNLFKRNCIIAGISPDTYFSDEPIDKSLEPERKKIEKKYIVRCLKCGRSHERVRFPKGINDLINRYHCAYCKGKFEVIAK